MGQACTGHSGGSARAPPPPAPAGGGLAAPLAEKLAGRAGAHWLREAGGARPGKAAAGADTKARSAPRCPAPPLSVRGQASPGPRGVSRKRAWHRRDGSDFNELTSEEGASGEVSGSANFLDYFAKSLGPQGRGVLCRDSSEPGSQAARPRPGIRLRSSDGLPECHPGPGQPCAARPASSSRGPAPAAGTRVHTAHLPRQEAALCQERMEFTFPEGVLGPQLRGCTQRKVPVCAGRREQGPPSLLGVLWAPRKTHSSLGPAQPQPPQPHSFPSCARTGWPSSQLHAALPAARRPGQVLLGPPSSRTGAAPQARSRRKPQCRPLPPQHSPPSWLPHRGARQQWGSLTQEGSLLCNPRCPPHSRVPTY